MCLDLIHLALSKGAKPYTSISGGKDSQAMVRSLSKNNIPIAGLLHADLGTVEWPESITHCRKLATEYHLPLVTIRRKDGRRLLEHWQHRMHQLHGKNIPF
jgi:3'-phosphoadenosine 5'-phosphosulfate sulfotransferase (PAPS reductase)/FAD synthetase